MAAMPTKPVEYVNIEVDGKPLSVRKDMYLLWSLRDNYLSVPHFCAHKWLDPPFGGCRMCMVQIETGGKIWPKLQTSCSTLPSEGMKVYTQTEPVLTSRKEQLEFHLINHPLECPVCDKGGECMLQDQTMEHGMAEGRFIEEKRTRPDAIINEYMQMNYKRCFQCKRCIHYNEMIDGTHMMKFVKRGASTHIESFPPPGEAPRFSGNLIDICPVGAITARNYRFMGRPWEQELAQSVGSLDSVGANVWNCARLGELTRIIPRDNNEVDFGYLDDATRFSWECTDSGRYLEGAIIRREGEVQPVSAGRGEREAGRILSDILGEHGPDSVGLIASAGLNCEDYLALRLFAQRTLKTRYFHFGEDLCGPGGLDRAVLRSFAAQAASIETICNAGTVLSVGCDLFEEAPVLGLRIDIAAHRQKTSLL
jgi:NADH-quinone oxidoreductase subunit G